MYSFLTHGHFVSLRNFFLVSNKTIKTDAMASGSAFYRSHYLWLLAVYLLLFREENAFSSFLRLSPSHHAKFNVFIVAISARYKESSPWIQVRHFVTVTRGRGFLQSKIHYYANSDSCFQQTRLLVSGDVSSNPGINTCYIFNYQIRIVFKTDFTQFFQLYYIFYCNCF